jgi:hypothetical protein
MVWHGTSIFNVHCFLREGFFRSHSDYIWLQRTPRPDMTSHMTTSFRYAPYPAWHESEYRHWGALWGLEMSGECFRPQRGAKIDM